jgi:hypothetical protein
LHRQDRSREINPAEKMAMSDIERGGGDGLAVIDPHGDVVEELFFQVIFFLFIS